MKNSYHSTTVPAIEAVTTLRSSVLLLASSVGALWVTEPIVCVQSSEMGKGYGRWGPAGAGRSGGTSVAGRRLQRAVDLGDQDAAVLVGQPRVQQRRHGVARLGHEGQGGAGRLPGVDREPEVLVQQRHGEPALE